MAHQRGLLKYLDGKTLLVTGGTGSFGETVVSVCLNRSRVKRVIVYSRDEQKHVAMRRKFRDPRLKLFIGDVRDFERLGLAMRGVDCVFNAAAIKHVHFTEEHPMEAIATNVVGADNVCRAALAAGVKVLVSLSTDKAVEPVNAMGMSKALQERVVASYAGRGMRVGVVRYGNVLSSNGSVVPFFRELLRKGERTLPVTDNRMTRFVLTLEDSVDLVLYAMSRCRNGEIFVLDLPAFRIWDVAEVMADGASGNGKPVKVKEIGIRPGEKLHETLISPEEMRRAVRRKGFWMIRRCESAEELFRPGGEEKRLSSDQARRLSKEEIWGLLERNGCSPR